MKIDTLEQRQQVINNKTLAFIGDEHTNWDTFVDADEKLFAVPKPDRLGCHMTPFGDKHHILRLMRNGYHSDKAAEAGLELMSGLHSRLMVDTDGKKFHFLTFD